MAYRLSSFSRFYLDQKIADILEYLNHNNTLDIVREENQVSHICNKKFCKQIRCRIEKTQNRTASISWKIFCRESLPYIWRKKSDMTCLRVYMPWQNMDWRLVYEQYNINFTFRGHQGNGDLNYEINTRHFQWRI